MSQHAMVNLKHLPLGKSLSVQCSFHRINWMVACVALHGTDATLWFSGFLWTELRVRVMNVLTDERHVSDKLIHRACQHTKNSNAQSHTAMSSLLSCALQLCITKRFNLSNWRDRWNEAVYRTIYGITIIMEIMEKHHLTLYCKLGAAP